MWREREREGEGGERERGRERESGGVKLLGDSWRVHRKVDRVLVVTL
jgi:hypothetical protein